MQISVPMAFLLTLSDDAGQVGLKGLVVLLKLVDMMQSLAKLQRGCREFPSPLNLRDQDDDGAETCKKQERHWARCELAGVGGSKKHCRNHQLLGLCGSAPRFGSENPTKLGFTITAGIDESHRSSPQFIEAHPS